VNTRAHPLDLAFARTVSALPVVALGLWQSPSEDLAHLVAAYLALSTVWAFVVHSNLHWRLGWLEQFIVSPAFHHWHHAGAGDGPEGINYASLLPWLDRLFGTHHLPRDRFPQTYGVDESQPDTLLGQLLSPFRRDSHPRIPAADAADAGTRIRRNRVR
jgi:sterol desaturase/sphingolipid hydroxylase (fatty acid hydroxylase superfamily)